MINLFEDRASSTDFTAVPCGWSSSHHGSEYRPVWLQRPYSGPGVHYPGRCAKPRYHRCRSDRSAVPSTSFCHSLTIMLGSGKTAAYLIPTISKLMGKVKKLAGRRPNLVNGFNPEVDAVRAEPLILVVAPTRELCTQIFDEARRLCYRSMLRPCVAYGGAPKREQQDELQSGCDVLIATPGRLLDFMSAPHVLTLGRVR